MRILILLCFMAVLGTTLQAQESAEDLAQEYLKNVKIDLPCDSVKLKLSQISSEDLSKQLSSDAVKLAFWLNIYNAITQENLHAHPEWFKDKKSRATFYGSKLIKVGGKHLSLDQIEHGILRRNMNKFSLGYVKKLFSRGIVRQWRPSYIDPRIHFSLNCGASSCPPILFYESNKVQEQLDISSGGYLQSECQRSGDTLAVPALFSWFRGDFGGKKGMYQMLEKYGVLQTGERPKIIYKAYNWELSLKNYQ